ncbi:hypothetical protein GJ496_003658 [Pomphorhynchus laevis]|nr:hypothetical protein GJ496_003658 [Pomphorhynchus laevis]
MGYKPVAYASRILQTAEKQYQQIDKEALALIFGIRKFHKYIAGRKFIIETDHKPLQHIFDEKRNLQKTVNHRLVRWATILNQYNYTLQFIKGSDNMLADMLSRLPQQESTQTKGDDDPAIVHPIQDEAAEQSGLSLDSILSATNLDAELRLVKSYITRGWPTTMPTHLKAYQSHAQDLSIESGATTYSVECHGRYIRGHIDQLRRRYRETKRQVVSGFDWPAIETSDTTYEKNDKERNSDDATRNDLEQPAENLASTEKIVTETLGSNTDANLQQENGPHNDSNQAMTVLRQSERKRTRLERFGASWPW